MEQGAVMTVGEILFCVAIAYVAIREAVHRRRKKARP